MVEKVSPGLTLRCLRSLQWQRLFHMFYIEPVVFMLLFSLTLSSKCEATCYMISISLYI